MKITIITVGKTSSKPLVSLMDDYKKRLKHYIRFDWIEIPDNKNRGKVSNEELKKLEGQAMLKNVANGDDLILLDEKGKEYTSVELSNLLRKKMNGGTRNLILVIGGAYGFSDEVYNRANGKMALSKLTFPHQLIRVFLLEQIYRGFTIIKGEPYHHV